MTSQEFIEQVDTLTRAYVEAALWAESAWVGQCKNPDCGHLGATDENDRCEVCGGEAWGMDLSFQDRGYGVEDFAEDALVQIKAVCEVFQERNGHLLTTENCPRLPGECTVLEYAGHDLWLTQTGAGCGFWDGDWEEKAGKELSIESHRLPIHGVYLGDDGKIHVW